MSVTEAAYPVVVWTLLGGFFAAWAVVGDQLVFPSVAALACLAWGAHSIWTTPLRIEVGDDRLIATWLGGRTRSWSLATLKIVEGDYHRARWFSTQVDVVGKDDKVFHIPVSIGHFTDLYDVLAPGARAQSDERRKRSWWSRDIW